MHSRRIASLALNVVWYFMPHLWAYIYDYETIGVLLRWSGYGAKAKLTGPALYLVIAIYVASLVGIYLFRSWGRTLFLGVQLFAIATAPLFGLSVEGGYDIMVGGLATLANGSILTMAYLTSQFYAPLFTTARLRRSVAPLNLALAVIQEPSKCFTSEVFLHSL